MADLKRRKNLQCDEVNYREQQNREYQERSCEEKRLMHLRDSREASTVLIRIF